MAIASFVNSTKTRLGVKEVQVQELGYLQSRSQQSRLLSLPKEVQQRIYGYVFNRWSLAIFQHDEQVELEVDDTFSFRKSGDKLLSGPPGCNLLLVCRSIYNDTRSRYGESCTGKLMVGKLKGKLRRSLPAYLESHPVFRRFYEKIRSLYLYFSLNTGHLDMNFRTFFPNIDFAQCLIHEGEYGPLVRHDGSPGTFLRGLHNDDMCDWTRPIVYHVIGSKRRWIRAVHDTSCVFDDKEMVVDIKVIAGIVRKPDIVLGFNYRWEGVNLKLVSRVASSPETVAYWEAPWDRKRFKAIDLTKSDRSALPERHQWVRHLKW